MSDEHPTADALPERPQWGPVLWGCGTLLLLAALALFLFTFFVGNKSDAIEDAVGVHAPAPVRAAPAV